MDIDKIIDVIIDDISGRKGIGDEWYQIDDDIQEEIKATWREKIEAIPQKGEGE